MADWNPWHGCHKISAGCQNCYVYRRDELNQIDSSVIRRNASFTLPADRYKNGTYKIKPGEFVWTCFTSDFLLEEADQWRDEAWSIIRERNDLTFLFITKRIHRFRECMPEDWGEGYDNVRICCTVENQDRADFRLPIFRELPIRHKSIVCEPLLEAINLTPYLGSWVKSVVAGGESGKNARVCDYRWILNMREQCMLAHVPFVFKQTGALFQKDGRIYRVPRQYQQSQARKAGINYLMER